MRLVLHIFLGNRRTTYKPVLSRFSTIKADMCVPLLHGRWHLGCPGGWNCQREPGGKAGCLLCLWEKTNHLHSLFALNTLSRSHRYLLPCSPASLYCVDVTVINVLTYQLCKSSSRPTLWTEALAGQSLKTPWREHLRPFGFDHHCGQPSRFENRYHAVDTTFIFHDVSALQLRE